MCIRDRVTTINEYNDILALWIKMKQGSLSLNIETFELNELFELLRKGSRTFEMKRQSVSYTHLDVYKRQTIRIISISAFMPIA